MAGVGSGAGAGAARACGPGIAARQAAAATSGRDLRVAIVTDAGGWHVRELQRALRERGCSGRCIDLADCRVDTRHGRHGLALPGFGDALPEAALVRGVAGGSFEQVTLRLGVLHMLAALGVPVYNEARAIERSVDKAMTSLLLHAAGLPAPPTWAMESMAAAQRIVTRESAAGRSLVLKPLFGSQGKGVERVGWIDGRHVGLPAWATHPRGSGDAPASEAAASAPPSDGPPAGDPDAALYGGVAYLQAFVEPLAQPGHDWRVLVVGGRAVAAMRRVSAHWVHNVARGARCEREPLDAGVGPGLARLAEAATRALDMDYAGVDLIPSADGPQILEVNGVAAWRGLQRVTRVDLARAIVDDLLDRKCARLAGRQSA